MLIEDLKPENIKECVEIYNKYVLDSFFTPEEKELGEREYSERANGIVKNGFPFSVAKDDSGKVTGFAYLDFFNTRSGYRYTAELSVYAADRLSRQSIGGKLLEHIEQKARARGLTNIISVITRENTASCSFHENTAYS